MKKNILFWPRKNYYCLPYFSSIKVELNLGLADRVDKSSLDMVRGEFNPAVISPSSLCPRPSRLLSSARRLLRLELFLGSALSLKRWTDYISTHAETWLFIFNTHISFIKPDISVKICKADLVIWLLYFSCFWRGNSSIAPLNVLVFL